jgi:hypothetical protein
MRYENRFLFIGLSSAANFIEKSKEHLLEPMKASSHRFNGLEAFVNGRRVPVPEDMGSEVVKIHPVFWSAKHE